jgi:hypothetical protein
MFKTITGTLAAAVVAAGTFTVAYPTGTNAGTFLDGAGHTLIANGATFTSPGDISVAFGTSEITVTYNGTTPLAAGTNFYLQLEELGENDGAPDDLSGVYRTVWAPVAAINLGAPDTLDADGVCTSASITAASGGTIGGALASGGVATFDVPRNVVITSAGNDSAKTFTVTGTDEYGNAVVENITGANAGAASGKKAFKTVTAVDIDSNSAGNVTVGTGDVLGLPVALPDTGFVLGELEDNQAASAGTLVAAVASTASATTGDVRGTYDPDSACNGTKTFTLLVALTDPTYKGVAQYAG